MMTILPLVILFILSGYLTIVTFDEYKTHKKFKHMLENVKLLQNYETAVLNEVLCMTLVPKDTKKDIDICADRIAKSSMLQKDVEEKDENLNYWKQKLLSIKENSLKYPIDNFERILGRENIVSTVKSYLDKIELHTDSMKEKELLKVYSRLSEIGYATELENFLLTYYLSKKMPVSTLNIIFWDKIIESSYLLNVENEISIPLLKEKLLNILRDDKLHATLNKINDMHFSILRGKILDESKNFDGIVLLEEKQTSLDSMKSIVYNMLTDTNQKYMNGLVWLLLLYSSIVILVLLSLFYNYLKIKKEKSENQTLLSLVRKINALSIYDKRESTVMDKMLDEAKNREDIFAYIHSSFQLLHEKFKQTQDEATSKSQFLSTLSHEIRTPLNGIIGFSKLLKDMGTTADQDEFLSLIEGSSHKLIMIVNDILDLSKMNADKMEIEDVSFNIFDMVESTVATFIQETDQKDIELGVFVDPFLAYHFLGDATKLSQILINLIGNAVKFTEPYGKINIFVQSIQNSKYQAKIKFSVQDTGIGLSKEQIKNIFNAFSQATISTSRKYGGTGLGLTISRKMVELMGGKLEVESQINQGTTFYFTLTLKKDSEKTSDIYPDFTGVSIGLALPSKNIKRQLDTNLEVYLRHLGVSFSIYYYEDLFENTLSIDLPDIMIFDHHYARLSGELEQCALLDCKTVLLTNGSLRSRVNAQRHTFDKVVLTPISLRKCIRILDINKVDKGIENESYKKQSDKLENVESFTGLCALVADDNLINRKLIKIILEKLGLFVSLASNGKEACDAYKKTPYDIVFMDIQMPVMDGVESTHCILEYERKNALPHVPVIALTANVATGDKERYIAKGMDDYATKPLEVDTIKSIILKHCSTDVSSKSKEK